MGQSAPALSADEKRWRMITATMRKNGYAPSADVLYQAITELLAGRIPEVHEATLFGK